MYFISSFVQKVEKWNKYHAVALAKEGKQYFIYVIFFYYFSFTLKL